MIEYSKYLEEEDWEFEEALILASLPPDDLAAYVDDCEAMGK